MIPASTKIRRSRVGNIDNARLWRRRSFLIHMVRHAASDFESRVEWATKVAELAAVEDELQRRGFNDTVLRRMTLDRKARL